MVEEGLHREHVTLDAAVDLARSACIAFGASSDVADSLARACVDAEICGQQTVGLAHLFDYLDAMEAGRIDPHAVPLIASPAPTMVQVDARGGIAHLGFDRAFDWIHNSAETYGLGMFAQRNAYTCGALGRFAERLAEQGLVALAATNGPALLTVPGASGPVYCTNPLAFAAPIDGGVLLIDQASSATAYVNVRQAAARGTPLTDGWAVDENGKPTTDAGAAIKGALLAFGGARGGNIALMVEVLAAGLTGASWSLDAPSFNEGSRCPDSGLLVLAIRPDLLDAEFRSRLTTQADRLAAHGVHIPGRNRQARRLAAARDGIQIDADLLARLRARGMARTTTSPAQGTT
jgi:(2R)-3-sulfolactate dehydrogenase (NADP+)